MASNCAQMNLVSTHPSTSAPPPRPRTPPLSYQGVPPRCTPCYPAARPRWSAQWLDPCRPLLDKHIHTPTANHTPHAPNQHAALGCGTKSSTCSAFMVVAGATNASPMPSQQPCAVALRTSLPTAAAHNGSGKASFSCTALPLKSNAPCVSEKTSAASSSDGGACKCVTANARRSTTPVHQCSGGGVVLNRYKVPSAFVVAVGCSTYNQYQALLHQH